MSPRIAGFAERVHEPLYPTVVLTERQYELVATLRDFHDTASNRFDAWVRPMDLGGKDCSHHHKTLRQLIKKGVVERRARGATEIETALPEPAILSRRRSRHAPRKSYVYRLTELGRSPRLVLRRRR